MTPRRRPEPARWVEAYDFHWSRVRGPVAPEVRAFLAEQLGLLGEDEPTQAAKRSLHWLGCIAQWSWDGGQRDLDPARLLCPENRAEFDRFAATRLTHRSRATGRSVLVGLAVRLVDVGPRPPRLRRGPHIAAPYTRAEEPAIVEVCAGQDPRVRNRALAAVALGFGAGVAGHSVVYPEDVYCDNGVVLVRVGGRSPREVPVRRQYEQLLLEVVEEATPGRPLAVTSPDRPLSATLYSLRRPYGCPPVSGPRLRATWLTRHIEEGTRLPELLAAAGIRGTASLAELVAAVAPMGDDSARWMLRGGRPQ